MRILNSFQRAKALDRLPEQFFAQLVAKVNRLVEEGHDVINLGQGNPDLPTPSHIVEALKQAAEEPRHHRYPPFRGHDFLKEAVAQFYEREYGVKLNPQTEVAILFGGKAGLVEIAQCLLNPGDVALVPDPGYPDYWSGIAMANAEMAMMPLLAENRFLPDLDAIDAATWDRAKCMFLNYPNNPTGAVADADFFAQVVNKAERENVWVIHDFAYAAIGFDGLKPRSFLQTPGAKEVGIEIYTMSKTYNMAGWRIGFALGNEDVIESIQLLQDHFYVSLFGAIQQAAATALLSSQDCVRELVATYERRRNVFIDRLRKHGWDVKKPAGSFFCWLSVPDGYRSQSFADLMLEQAHVAVAPGVGFGRAGDAYVRVGLLTSEGRLVEAADRIAKWLPKKNALTSL